MQVEKKVFIIDKKYVIKIATVERLKAEKLFIEKNKKIRVEKIIDSNVDKNFNVYEYIDGSEISYLSDVDDCLREIYNITNQYSKTEIAGYGDIFELKKTWIDFIKDDIFRQSKYIKYEKNRLLNKVISKMLILEKYKIDKRIIHGDLGCFNIICKEKQIEGIIDPRTIIGDPLYDFIYFIFSNFNIAKVLDFYEILNLLKEPREKIFAMLYIMLYDRIAREQKNNTKYKDKFLTIWDEIEKIEEIYY